MTQKKPFLSTAGKVFVLSFTTVMMIAAYRDGVFTRAANVTVPPNEYEGSIDHSLDRIEQMWEEGRKKEPWHKELKPR